MSKNFSLSNWRFKFIRKTAFFIYNFIFCSDLLIKLDIFFLCVKIIRIRKINNNNFRSLTMWIFGSIIWIIFSFIKETTNTVSEEKIEDKDEYLKIKVVLNQVKIKSNANPWDRANKIPK